MRNDGRQPNKLRPVTITRRYIKCAEGSVLIEVGDTRVVCTASVENKVPPFLRNSGQHRSMTGQRDAQRNSLSLGRISASGPQFIQIGRNGQIQRIGPQSVDGNDNYVLDGGIC